MNQARENYLGNPNLKRANVPQEFTPEQVEEFVKCSQDAIYFIQNYIQIVNIDEGLVPFNLYDFQEDIVKLVQDERFVICKMPRQSGKTTTIAAKCTKCDQLTDVTINLAEIKIDVPKNDNKKIKINDK